MPELPEVEAVARSLDATVRGRTILSAELLRPRLAPENTPQEFSEKLKGQTIEIVDRRGKHILLHLSGGTTLIVHLRMSGRFLLVGSDEEQPKFTHAAFDLDTGERLVFDDQRHFGLMKVVETADLYEAKELKKLAPEPFSTEFSVTYFLETLKRSRRSVKELLIDQTKVCGLGNIYACEAMFAAGVDPRKRSDLLSRPRAARLHESIKMVLSEAIEFSTRTVEGITPNYFYGSNGAKWYVYDREGEPCAKCGSTIARIKQGMRSTYFCRRCQRR